ncbi:hypothetical protein H311_04667 [Anncaliia algerae PRA109]|nr:hypothetical protein H311_04667 [Anncaliia algerae PRA109]
MIFFYIRLNYICQSSSLLTCKAKLKVCYVKKINRYLVFRCNLHYSNCNSPFKKDLSKTLQQDVIDLYESGRVKPLYILQCLLRNEKYYDTMNLTTKRISKILYEHKKRN